MLKYVVAMLCGVSLSGSVYMAGWSPQARGVGEECEYCATEVADPKPLALGIDMTGKVDVKNTKCIVMEDSIGSSKNYVEYKGSVYRICCSDCVATFNKNPEKYVKALESEPLKFGVAK